MDKIIISGLILAGSFFILVAAIGLVRFPDLFSRLHAGTKAPSFGILLIVLGVCLYFNTPVIYLKGFFILIFIYLTAPLAAHAISRSFKQKD
ncbi:MAG: monovalent cation/H(+) antiporter subunit G [Mariniphaga sp.]|jgi:multicomponent Na+:H+ antiporter subunit G|nr:monovalent cation/H(+) antiporter subunit G [Mariniphaga sp.]MDD4227186.1 monovalent cation/H(+) antiporter subunit G [Mariniphaga sp.]MDD4426357.1 monovalent cation/H(+) antiporter subunit G [Mariniphaga sp.]